MRMNKSKIGIQTILIRKNIIENSKELIISNFVYCVTERVNFVS